MSKLEKAAQQYSCELRELDKKNVYDNIDVDSARMVAFKRGAEWQAKQSPWISVDEQLPEESLINPSAWSVTYKVFVLTSNDNASISQRRWNCNTNRWEWAGSGSFKDSIVSWMPIPE